MSNQQQGQFPAPKRTIINSNIFNMMAPCPSAEGKWSSFTLHASNDGLSITVWTRDPQDANNQNGSIKFKAPLPLAFMIFKAIDEVARGKVKERSFKHEDFTFMAGKRSDKKVLISTLIVGRDESGIYISVRAYKSDRPRINFYFGSAILRSYEVLDESGNKMSMVDVSRDAALAYIDALARVLAYIVAKDYKHPEPKPGPGNSGGQRSSGGSQGGSYQAQASSSSDEDDNFF